MSAYSFRVRSRRVWLTTLGIAALVLGTVAPATALPTTSTPVLSLNHLIETKPFAGSTTSMRDNEDSVYVPQDNSLWLVDDDAHRVYEIDATSGALKQTFASSVFEALPQSGGGPAAGVAHDRDFESLAYDASTDTLYAFSGVSGPGMLPAAFRFTRTNGQLTPVDYQPLPTGSDFTAAAWNPTENKIYVGVRHDIQTYDYATNTVGTAFQISGVAAIEGFEFTQDGNDLFVSRSQMGGTNPYQMLTEVDWATKKTVPGWNFDLTPFGIKDARGVSLINDQFYISDGYDFRTAGDPKDHAVFVLDVTADNTPAVQPVASFTSASDATNPLTVHFTDTSLNKPTSWTWRFGDGKTSVFQNPNHPYASAGTYNVTLTVTNAAGSSTTAAVPVTVTAGPAPTAPTAAFQASRTSGGAPMKVTFANHSTGATSYSWSFGDGSRSTSASPTHRFLRPGRYTVTLTAKNAQGTDTARTVIRTRDAVAPTGRFAISPRRAHLRHTRVAILQRSLHDNFTPT
ncbi:MAG TPA: PKD domain-containing protein, partial [Marmoricola sp.]